MDRSYILSNKFQDCQLRFIMTSGVVAGGGQGSMAPPVTFFRGAKISNCQCEISYRICKVQLVNKFKVVVILAFL